MRDLTPEKCLKSPSLLSFFSYKAKKLQSEKTKKLIFFISSLNTKKEMHTRAIAKSKFLLT